MIALYCPRCTHSWVAHEIDKGGCWYGAAKRCGCQRKRPWLSKFLLRLGVRR